VNRNKQINRERGILLLLETKEDTKPRLNQKGVEGEASKSGEVVQNEPKVKGDAYKGSKSSRRQKKVEGGRLKVRVLCLPGR